jgi:hypothetical protein
MQLEYCSNRHSNTKKPGIFTYEQEITVNKPSLLVRFTIVGQGSDTQPPKGLCLVLLEGSQLNPYLAAAITSGNSAKSVEYLYMLGGNMASAEIHHFHPLLSPGTAVKVQKKAKPTQK